MSYTKDYYSLGPNASNWEIDRFIAKVLAGIADSLDTLNTHLDNIDTRLYNIQGELKE